MKLRFLRVNSFTDQPFSGNPATVCFLAEPPSEDWMQSVAAEMNTGGTAFLTESGGEFGLRFVKALRQMRPDFPLLATIPTRGVMVTSAGGPGGYDFVSRFFAPRAGLPEDQVTGSAHCCLGPFWMERLGKKELLAYQASRRGGSLRVRVEGERVMLAGQAVTVLRGNLTTPAE